VGAVRDPKDAVLGERRISPSPDATGRISPSPDALWPLVSWTADGRQRLPE